MSTGPNCKWCGTLLTGRATLYCSKEHGDLYRKDQSYFGGNLRSTKGWEDRTCQICGKSNLKGMQAHHVYGIGNDPKGTTLVLLCAGCHQIVTILGNRNFNIDSWQRLIRYSWMRKRGRMQPPEPWVQVHIEEAE